MSLLGFGKHLAGAMSEMTSGFGKFFADAFVFAVIEGDPRPPEEAAHRDELEPVCCRTRLLHSVTTLATSSDKLPKAAMISLWDDSGHSIANILHAIAQEAASGRPPEIRWKLHYGRRGIQCVPIDSITGIISPNAEPIRLWGVKPPADADPLCDTWLLLPEHVLPRKIIFSTEGHSSQASYGDMLIISRDWGLAVPLVWYVMTQLQGCTYAMYLTRALHDAQRGRYYVATRAWDKIRELCKDNFLQEIIVAVERGQNQTRDGDDPLARGLHIEDLRANILTKHQIAMPQPHVYVPTTVPWRHWRDQVETLFVKIPHSSPHQSFPCMELVGADCCSLQETVR